jgi:hypothetical protein
LPSSSPPTGAAHVKPTTAEMPGSAAVRYAAHCAACCGDTRSALLRQHTSGLRSVRVTWRYSAGGRCSSGWRTSMMHTTTSARSTWCT